MSGPKVLIVVTRQDLLDICRGHIAEIDASIAEWRRIAERNGLFTQSNFEALQSRKQTILELLAKDHVSEIQKQAPLIAEWIHQDIVARVEQQYLATLQERKRDRSVRVAAANLIARCRERNVALPEELTQLLGDALSEHLTKDELERGISRALTILGAQSQSEATGRQTAIAGRLGAGEKPLSLDAWVAQSAPKEPRIDVIERQLAQVAALDGIAAKSTLTARWEAIAFENDIQRRGLLMDSLSLELASALKDASQVAELSRAIAFEKAAAHVTGELGAQRDAFARIESQAQALDFQGAREQLERIRRARLGRETQKSEQGAREGVLRGLHDLGYDIREGMSTIWMQNKRLVVRHPARSGVAVELAGNAVNGRMQARMVAIQGQSHGSTSDKQIEEQWCSDVGQLQQLITDLGGALTIEKAVEAGVHPLKMIDDQWHYEDDDNISQQTRSQR